VLRDVLQSRPVWRQAARSELERAFRAAVEHRGLPMPGVNEKVTLPDGRVIEVDLTWLPWSVVGEVDHPFWHDGAAEAHRDKRRDRKMLTMGIETMRFTDIDVETALDESLNDLEAVLRRHGWAPGANVVGE
jgi:very-short-patch-repair endonuclease